MKIFSAELNRKNNKMTAKAVVMLKKRNGYVLLKNYTTDADNLQPLSAGLPLGIAINHYDIIDETLFLPPVKDLRTFRIIAYNKLKENLDVGTEYLMSYKENVLGEPDDSGNMPHKVFLVPKSLLDETARLNEQQKKDLTIFTVTEFALSGIVKDFFPGKLVFHAYADEDKITVTVCQDDVILYSRVNELYFNVESERNGAYYENLNLTYMYVTKNLRLDVNMMVLSGALADNQDLSKMVAGFTSTPQSVLLPAGKIENCSYKVFQQYMIPIALNYVNDSYDFTPIEYKVEQGENFITAIASVVTLALIVFMLFLNATALDSFLNEKEKLLADSRIMQLRLKKYTESLSETASRKHGLYYYHLLKEKENDVLEIYEDTLDLVDLAVYETVSFANAKEGKALTLRGKIAYEDLRAIDEFKRKFEAELEKIGKKNNYDIKNQSRFSMDELTAEVNLVIIVMDKKG
jgi:hypothetical protein